MEASLSKATSPGQEVRTVLIEGALSALKFGDPISTAKAWHNSAVFKDGSGRDTHSREAAPSLAPASLRSLIPASTFTINTLQPQAIRHCPTVCRPRWIVASCRRASMLRETSRIVTFPEDAFLSRVESGVFQSQIFECPEAVVEFCLANREDYPSVRSHIRLECR